MYDISIKGLYFDNATGRIIPNYEQSLLINAAIKPTEDAFKSWQTWKSYRKLISKTEFEERTLADIYDILDGGSQRLLPLIFRNLEKTGDTDILLLKSYYKNIWVKNQQAMATLNVLINDLKKINIECVVLKGLAMVIGYYKDAGLRVTGDYDVLIPYSNKKRVVDYFKYKWNVKLGFLEACQSKEFHAASFKLQNGLEFDVHWHLNYENAFLNTTDIFFNASVDKTTKQGFSCKILAPTHLIFHTIVHGISLSNINAIRWITDCVVIDKHETIDWQAVSELCIQYNYKLPFAIACKVLPSFGINIPIAITSDVATWSFTKNELAFYNLIASYKGKQDSWYNKIVGTYYYKKAMYNQFRKGNTKQVFMVWYLKSFILAVAIWLKKRL